MCLWALRCSISADAKTLRATIEFRRKKMPAGKYYCDYCEKEFQDTPAARKRHLQSNPHLRAKSLWFRSLAAAQSQTHHDRVFSPRPPSSSSWFNSNSAATVAATQTQIAGELSKGWADLPPSLKPPPEGAFLQIPFVDWG